MKSSSLLKAGPQCVWVEQTTNRSRFSPTLLLQPRRDFFGHLGPDRAVVDGHQHGGAAFAVVVATDRQSPGLEPAGDSL